MEKDELVLYEIPFDLEALWLVSSKGIQKAGRIWEELWFWFQLWRHQVMSEISDLI